MPSPGRRSQATDTAAARNPARPKRRQAAETADEERRRRSEECREAAAVEGGEHLGRAGHGCGRAALPGVWRAGGRGPGRVLRPVVITNLSSTIIMSLACLVCHGMSSPSQSFRSYSVSSSEDENRCGAAVACLSRKIMAAGPANRVGTSKVTPVMATGQGIEGAPRLQRSRAVSRDLVRDWNFDEIVVGN
ncbi:hypothetical protein D1007_48837 [Hordeum vulgare]|nr:hypothetical protein D1007_48837 [Hordeum vulgare]